jgi:hypothetical protein
MLTVFLHFGKSHLVRRLGSIITSSPQPQAALFLLGEPAFCRLKVEQYKPTDLDVGQGGERACTSRPRRL